MSRKVSGNSRGLSPSQLKTIHRLFTRRVEKQEIVSLDLAREMYLTAASLKRRIGLLISREGRVEEVIIGSREILYIPDLGRYRLGIGRLRRLRLIFSDLSLGHAQVHIPLDIYTDLEKLRLDLVAGVRLEKNKTNLAYAYNIPYRSAEAQTVQTEQIDDIGRFDFDFAEFISELEAEHSAAGAKAKLQSNQAVLVGVYPKSSKNVEASMRELEELARTAGVEIADRIIQRRQPDPKTLLGRGKLEDVILRCLRLGAELIVFDTELKPSQWRVITNSTELKVIDRSMLILDIFAQHAKSSDGRLQVELAQLKYNLPRLVEKDAGLSRLTGEIGGRGPGETKLEIGRRRIREKIARLEQRIDKLSQQRGLRRKKRKGSRLPLVAVLGYTNVGKSTLFNALCKSSVLVESKLFATLDPAQRRLFLPFEHEEPVSDWGAKVREVVLADTVGFIRDLPKELFSAFRATLEEISGADLLLHVLDASDQALFERKLAVDSVIKDMGLAEVPQLLIVNKCDLVAAEQVQCLENEFNAIAVSALKEEALEKILFAIKDHFQKPTGAALS